VAEFGKRTGGSLNGIGNKREVPHRGAPLHLRVIAYEFAGETAEHRIGVIDIQPLVHSMPDHLKGNGSWYWRRTAAEQCIRDISVIEDGYTGPLEGCASFSKVDVDPSNWNLDGPEKTDGRKCSRIEVMNLIVRTGQVNINSNKRKSAVVHFPVRATELALHESHVRIGEWITVHIAGFGIGLRHLATDIS
jgi:hypothetical protein